MTSSDRLPVIVVGAGLAGLTCARLLSQTGTRVLVLEAADSIGGRVRTDVTPEGFVLDRGFQVVFRAYPAVRRMLDQRTLGLRPFDNGAAIVTAVAVAALTAARHLGQTYIVTGPALISHTRIAAIVSEVTGAEVHYEQVDVERFVGVLQQAGQPEWLASGVAELFEHMDSDVTDAVATALGAPIAFQEFAREHADAFGVPRQVGAP